MCPLRLAVEAWDADARMFEIVMKSRHVHVEVFLMFSCSSLYQRERESVCVRIRRKDTVSRRCSGRARVRAKESDLQPARWGSEFSPDGVYEH